jgi:hypothetical protein
MSAGTSRCGAAAASAGFTFACLGPSAAALAVAAVASLSNSATSLESCYSHHDPIFSSFSPIKSTLSIRRSKSFSHNSNSPRLNSVKEYKLPRSKSNASTIIVIDDDEKCAPSGQDNYTVVTLAEKESTATPSTTPVSHLTADFDTGLLLRTKKYVSIFKRKFGFQIFQTVRC